MKSRARKKLGRVESQKGEDQRWRKVRRQKMQVREKVGKSRNTVFFPVFCGSGGSKSRLAKAAGAEVASQMRYEKLHHRCGAKHILKYRVSKTPHAQTTFGS